MKAFRTARTVVLYLLLVLALQFGVIMAVNHDYAIATGTFAVTGSLVLLWKFRRQPGRSHRKA